MQKVTKILSVVIKVLALIIMAATAVLSLSMAYIMFAPDELPKPFKLVYQYPSDPPDYLPPGVIPIIATDIPAGEEGHVAAEVLPGEGLMMTMSTKIINLSDPTGRKYIRLTVVLEFDPHTWTDLEATEEASTGGGHGAEEAAPESNPLEEAIGARMPLMDDIVITILSSKTYDELYTAAGKEALRVEIMNEMNERLPEFHVISVYFTEFVVQ
jgi:flagellar FliL protein